MGATIRPHARNFFATVDTMDVATIAPLFTEDARVVFGNGQPLVGIGAIRTGISAFFATIAGQHHVFHTNAGSGIDDYRVYFDVAPIYA
jgi:ketosteroid isomerase-like protein